MALAVVPESDTSTMAWGVCCCTVFSAASSLSAPAGTSALATSGGSLSSVTACCTAARPARPMASSSPTSAMRCCPTVAHWRTILRASSIMPGRTWNTFGCSGPRSVSEAAKGAKSRLPCCVATLAPASLLAVPTKPNSMSALFAPSRVRALVVARAAS
ncbi:hypothetical protein D3C87_584070 [compost metagenome]